MAEYKDAIGLLPVAAFDNDPPVIKPRVLDKKYDESHQTWRENFIADRKASAKKLAKYSVDQPRDEHGEWTSAGGVASLEIGGRITSADLNDSEISAIWEYQGTDFRLVQDALKNLDVSNPQINEQITRLDSALSKAKTEADMVVYRGGTGRALNAGKPLVYEDWQNLAGKEVQFKTYTSTSILSRIASGFHDQGTDNNHVQYHILVPKGSHALFLGTRTFNSSFTDEQEVLLPSNSSFLVNKVEATGDRNLEVYMTYKG
jgi:hypothetical protein